MNRRLLVGGEVELADGDHIAVGPLLFLVTVEPGAPADLQKPDALKAAPHDAGSDTAAGNGPTQRTPHHFRPAQAQIRNDAEEVLYL